MTSQDKCINCGSLLVKEGNVRLCPRCNSRHHGRSEAFLATHDEDTHVIIECPGASLYESGTHEVVAGVRFRDNDDPSKGYDIVKHPVYAPNHQRHRRIPADAVGRLRRCQACQDYTVRMRRREGPDFYAPSRKHPGRKKLKSVNYVTVEPR